MPEHLNKCLFPTSITAWTRYKFRSGKNNQIIFLRLKGVMCDWRRLLKRSDFWFRHFCRVSPYFCPFCEGNWDSQILFSSCLALDFWIVCLWIVQGLSCLSFALRVLVDTVVHFPSSVEEVTMTANNERLWVRNHVEDEAGGKTRLTVSDFRTFSLYMNRFLRSSVLLRLKRCYSIVFNDRKWCNKCRLNALTALRGSIRWN